MANKILTGLHQALEMATSGMTLSPSGSKVAERVAARNRMIGWNKENANEVRYNEETMIKASEIMLLYCCKCRNYSELADAHEANDPQVCEMINRLLGPHGYTFYKMMLIELEHRDGKTLPTT